MRPSLHLLRAAILLSGIVTIVAANSSIPTQNPTTAVAKLAYHNHPPTESLPETLHPEQFETNRAAFVAYSLAAQTKETLYQVPCYCGCNTEQSHKSLLDCFTGTHGSVCHICQKEVLFCYLQRKKKQTPEEIRDAMAKGGATKLNLGKYVRRFYAQTQESHK